MTPEHPTQPEDVRKLVEGLRELAMFHAPGSSVRELLADSASALSASVAPGVTREEPFQERVLPWMLECFGWEIAGDKLERGDRLLEEVLELLQSGDYPAERVAKLVAYTYGRPKGEPSQEVGGVMVTLAAYCLAHALDMHEAGETELTRIWTKVGQIRAKQAAKPRGIALPVDPDALSPPHHEAQPDV